MEPTQKIDDLLALQNKSAIVTGGAQGLGLAVASRLASCGVQIFILDLQEQLAVQAAAQLPGKQHMGLRCDITDATERRKALSAVLAQTRHVDILVNNAGIQHHAPAEEMEETKWRQVFEVNVHAMMMMCRDVGGHMLHRKSGSIINIGSIASLLGMPRRSVYVTTKTAVLGLTRALATEWAARGVRVNAVGPGYHYTPLFEEYVQRGAIDELKIKARIPMGHMGSADDIGRAVLFFASALSKYVTGQFLMVDGGYTAYGAPEDVIL
jgi:NAD(P)-dependent dehydrogenase (short-subunit alcohol dehydrogenase family)